MTDGQPQKSYSSNFYREEALTSFNAAKKIMPIILDAVKPRSVVDVGCGAGMFLEVSKRLGAPEVLGIDGPWAAKTLAKGINFKEMDLSNPVSIGRTFDLAISLEVGEHLPKTSAAKFVNFLTSLAPVVLYSAAIPFQGGRLHINEQWQDYWAQLFAEQGYVPVDCVRPIIWNDTDVISCYRQNTLVYVRKDSIQNYPKLSAIGTSTNLNLVHPEVYTSILQTYIGYATTMMQAVKALPKPVRPVARYFCNKNVKKIAEQLKTE